MNNKLCIIISSEYPKSEADAKLWNDEVQADLTIVKATLLDHELVEIAIPAGTGLLSANKLVKRALDKIQTYYPTCHIVLNTHGVPGNCDLRHEMTQMIVQELSRRHTAITQISALLCDGMIGQTVEEAHAAHPHRVTFFSHNIVPKVASMRVLQQRLNAMVTLIPQDFNIRGFTYAYLPKHAQDKIIDVLNGHGGQTLTVSTQPYIAPSPAQYADELTSSMHLVKEYKDSERTPDKKYDKATNVLGAALTTMKDNLLAHLKHGHTLLSESQPLLDAIENYVVQQNESPDAVAQSLNACNFDAVYQRWLKDHKVYSKERMVVFESHLSLYLSRYSDDKPKPNSGSL